MLEMGGSCCAHRGWAAFSRLSAWQVDGVVLEKQLKSIAVKFCRAEGSSSRSHWVSHWSRKRNVLW